MLAYAPSIKRFLDMLLAGVAMVVLFPLLLVVSLLICLESKGGPFFIQERVGKGMRRFRLIKFRSMAAQPSGATAQFEPGQKTRITRIGKILRQTKVDELPELINIVKGDMSIIGPRPEVPKYVQMYPVEFAAILQVRPGLSDYASLKYRHEEELLAKASDPEDYYRTVILPDKLQLAKRYTKQISLKTDWEILIETLKLLFKRETTHM